jgi:predicted N-acyltransferase
MVLLLEQLRKDQTLSDARVLTLRDLPFEDEEMDRFLLDQGFSKFPMPKSLYASLDWKDEEGFLAGLSYRGRSVVRRDVLSRVRDFHVEIYRKGERAPSEEMLGQFYRLYKNVKAKNLGLNTFDLPQNIFHTMLEHPEWLLTALFLEADRSKPVAVSADFLGRGLYVPTVIGLDYEYVLSHETYRQSLYQAILRGKQFGASKLCLGMGATLEKERFGAVAEQRALYVQTLDQENSEFLLHVGVGLSG